MKIIGLNGEPGAGKDTAADVLVGLGWKRIAFADGVRDLAFRVNPIITRSGTTLAQMVRGYGWERAKRDVPGVREFLVNIGKAARETFGESVWVEHALRDYSADSTEKIVVTDMRFPNEVAHIKALGGLTVRIDSLRVPVSASSADRALDGYTFDTYLNNDTDENVFRYEVANYLGTDDWWNFHKGGASVVRTGGRTDPL